MIFAGNGIYMGELHGFCSLYLPASPNIEAQCMMNSLCDPIGQAVYNYHFKRIDIPVTVHSDEFDDDTLSSAYFFRSFQQMPPLEQKALSLCRGRVLDVGACAGAHALYLQQQGIDVTALEVSPLCCEVLRGRGVRKVVEQDIRSYQGEQFDTILLLMNGAGIAGTMSGLIRLLGHLKKLLLPGGQILLDSSDLIFLFEEEDGMITIDLNADKYYGEINFQTEYMGQKGEPFSWLYVDADSLKQAALQQQFADVTIIHGDHYDYLAQLTTEKQKV